MVDEWRGSLQARLQVIEEQLSAVVLRRRFACTANISSAACSDIIKLSLAFNSLRSSLNLQQ